MAGLVHGPLGPSSGIERVIRGGGWRSSIDELRCAARGRLDPHERRLDVGFRVVCDSIKS
jgi:formylglycine-generating enzyme required for sulfatase activity